MSVPVRKPVRWSNGACDDLAAIVNYIAQTAPKVAEALEEAIFAKIDLLKYFPELGSPHPREKSIRFLVHKGFVIYYTVHQKRVVVRAIARGVRLLRKSWRRRR